MSKQKAQGTRLESDVTRRFIELGMNAERIAEGGVNDIGDVRVRGPFKGESPIVAVYWRRLVNTGGKRRSPDGERDVIILDADDFYRLMSWANADAIIECKATERLNVTRTLAKAKQKARNNG